MPYEIPLADVKYCYSSHMLEHISDAAASYLLSSVYSIMRDGGVIRIEVPSASKILDDYKADSGRPIARYFADSNKETIVEQDGYDEKYAQIHIGTLGAISCIHVDRGNKSFSHIPVYADLSLFEANLSTMTTDEFCSWAIGLQTVSERAQHGHINYWTENKLSLVLEEAGFRDINVCNAGESRHGFDLSIERPHRAFYSLIMEAKR